MAAQAEAQVEEAQVAQPTTAVGGSGGGGKGLKLHGRAFYQSIGSPKYIVAPMVNQSEFAWRMLSRSFLSDQEKSKMLAYTPMFHARLFTQDPNYPRAHFQATRPASDTTTTTIDDDNAVANDDRPRPLWLDGNPAHHDRPLFVQFCANDPSLLLAAAQQVAPYCDAVDLNLGCPQGIARKGRYGAFLQEDQDLVFRLVRALHEGLSVPVTAKIRVLDTAEQTLAYARTVLRAGASILTVHGRRREQKGHLTGLADWRILRFLRDSLPPETVLFANGNVLQHPDVDECLAATGFDGVMSAEGNLSDPGVFAVPPALGEEGTEYWRGRDGKGGWRLDAVMRRYMDIIHRHVLEVEPPARRPLFMLGDDTAWLTVDEADKAADDDNGERAKKRRRTDEGNNTHNTDNINNNNINKNNTTNISSKKRKQEQPSPNLAAIQPHLFHLLRHLVTKHTDVRDMLARAPKAMMISSANNPTGTVSVDAFEKVLEAVEHKVAEGMLEYERTEGGSFADELAALAAAPRPTTDEGVGGGGGGGGGESSMEALLRCRRPWWVAQPIVRPLPAEALAKGSIRPKKKELADRAAAARKHAKEGGGSGGGGDEKRGREGRGRDDGY